MPEYQVMLECSTYCETYEDKRVVFTSNDPVACIDQSSLRRDQLHYSWVEKV